MKHLFLSMAAVAMLASCSSEEVLDKAQTPKSAIGFSTFVDKSTRATESDDIKTGSTFTFELNGWRTDANATTNEVHNFNRQSVTSTAGTCEYGPIQYWENNYNYTFEAVYPGNSEEGVTFTPAKAGSTINFDYTANNGETDLIYSEPQTVAGDATNAAAVQLSFKHLLSRVRFSFTNGFPSDAAAVLSISNLKITDAYNKGSITPVNNGVWQVSDANKGSIDFDGTSGIAVQNTGETPHKYIIPTTVENGKYTVTFTVTLNQGGATTNYDFSSTIDINMTMGHSYDYVGTISEKNIISGGLKPIVFEATVNGWTDWENPDDSNDTDKQIDWTVNNGTQK